MTAKSNRDHGKRCEATIARELGGTRRGIMGGHDVESGPFAVEVKSRNTFSGVSFMEQAVRNCPSGKTSLVVVHITGKRHERDMVMMRLKDWQGWHGNAC